MSKVYLVLENFHYEDTEVKKVFFTKEKALEYVANLEGGRLVDDGEARRYISRTVFIEEHEVEE